MSHIDKIDIETRKKVAELFHKKFSNLSTTLNKEQAPKLEIPMRTLANTVFDPNKGILKLGIRRIERNFLNMNEAKKFMQTLLMASIIYQALVENEYPTIRDLYYRGKHTIHYKDLNGRLKEENTWEEQSESDASIRDVEVMTGLLREDMLILSKEKGKVVGNMRIRSGNDVIDLSKLGHGAYAIESTPDLIEFLDYDAEIVLVVEKDAVFQQLHRAGFWQKYKTLLVTGAGQPDRATRRFVRRLNEELKLPVYILTDSDPYGWYIYSVFKVGSIQLS
ncbi:MAG: DNA topoisomerase IV subunit A, partial [Caldisphaera sp.]|nr:DNA topoisomerase IV subunit A [Caldisphaera sp.]